MLFRPLLCLALLLSFGLAWAPACQYLSGTDDLHIVRALDAASVDPADSADGTAGDPNSCRASISCGDPGKTCGVFDDGCGFAIHCGSCALGEVCVSGHCERQAYCGNAKCEAGETCANCAADCGCDGGRCVDATCCNPDCRDKECGDDGCKGSCGDCNVGELCQAGRCNVASSCGTGDCQPELGETCDSCPRDCQCKNGACVGGRCCEADCKDKECGSDGCGGSCGQCGSAQLCNGGKCIAQVVCGANGCQAGETCASCAADCSCSSDQVCTQLGQCCTPACGGKECGPDGCGGNCGTCGSSKTCRKGNCVDIVACGINGCQAGENCANCPSDCSCDAASVCVKGQCCTPSCADKMCGDDGCGGSCGTCSEGLSCNGGQCIGCGDGVCSSPEDCATCAADCGCVLGDLCYQGKCCTPLCSGTCGTEFLCGVNVPCGECAAGCSCVANLCVCP